ncbi:MAG: hypothetical protein OXF27_19470 [Acidobacteria bacterium]|nr:hypothetical protein [Acidobacteriota bacterium]
MPRGFAFAAVLLLLSAAARAQSDAELIAEATLPLPPQLKHDAEVVATGPDGRQRVIRAGRTALTCTPDGPEPGFSVTCINGSTGNVIAAYTGHLERGASIPEAWNAVNAAIEAGTLTTATPGTLIFIQSGPSRAEAAHLAVTLVPYATAEATGLPTRPTADRAWLMCPGTARAHIMLGQVPYGIDPNAGWERCLLPGQ